MKFVKFTDGADGITYEGVKDIPQVTEEMHEDGESEEILVEIAEQDGSGCDPIPQYLSLTEAMAMAAKVIEDIHEEALPNINETEMTEVEKILYAQLLKDKMHGDGYSVEIRWNINSFPQEATKCSVWVDGYCKGVAGTEYSAVFKAYDEIYAQKIESSLTDDFDEPLISTVATPK